MALRTLTTVDGGVLVERRGQHSEEGMSHSHQIVESRLPVADYEATLAVMDSAGGSMITWSGEFAARGAADAEARAVIEDLDAAGLAALRERLRQHRRCDGCAAPPAAPPRARAARAG